MPPIVFITGASSGIGEGLAKGYAARGANLILFARRKDRLETLAKSCKTVNPNSQAIVVTGDVHKREDIDFGIAEGQKHFGRIDIVFANAGFGVMGTFEELKTEDYRRQFETNVFGVLNTVYASLEALKQSHGRLCIIGSVTSYVSQPKKSAYCMSKFAIKALSDALYYELRPKGISVTLVCPGSVESEINRVDNLGKLQAALKIHPVFKPVRTQKAVAEIIQAVDQRKKEAIITTHGKIIVWVQRHFPTLLSLALRRM